MVVNLYPFEKIAANADATLEELIENIDIGGPTMIRAAAKNWQDVAVVTSPRDYAPLLEELQAHDGELSSEVHWELAKKAFATTAAYDRAISARLAQIPPDEDVLEIRAPRRFLSAMAKIRTSRPPFMRPEPTGIAGAEQLQGKELSYNNLVDLDAAWQLILEFDQPAAAIIKHTNPCGCAESATLAESYRRAFEADPISAFGGILAFNRPVDLATAEEILKTKTMVEAIAAPDYSAEALHALSGQEKCAAPASSRRGARLGD